MPNFVGHYRVMLDDGTEMKAHYHPDRGFTRFWQALPRVLAWREEIPSEKRDWSVIHVS